MFRLVILFYCYTILFYLLFYLLCVKSFEKEFLKELYENLLIIFIFIIWFALFRVAMSEKSDEKSGCLFYWKPFECRISEVWWNSNPSMVVKTTENHIDEVIEERDFNAVTNEHQLGRRERWRWQVPQLIVLFRSYLLSVRKNKSTLTQANYNSLTMSTSRESQCYLGTFCLSDHIRSIPGMRRGVLRRLSHGWQVVVP